MKHKKELEDLKVSFASLEEKYNQKIKACDMEQEHKSMMEDFGYMLSNLSKRLDYMSEGFYNFAGDHTKNHVPPIKTAKQMKNFLKACGMDEDYEVAKPYIYVSASNKGLNIEAEFSKENIK